MELKEAQNFIDTHHRHHQAAHRDKFRIAAMEDGEIVGVGRCFGKKYGKDVSVDNEPCKCYEFGGSKERLKEFENNMK